MTTIYIVYCKENFLSPSAFLNAEKALEKLAQVRQFFPHVEWAIVEEHI